MYLLIYKKRKIKRIYILCAFLLFHSSIKSYSQASTSYYWTTEELQKANTAYNVNVLTYEEREVIKYINLARLYPQKFAILEVKDYLGPSKYGDYLKTSVYKQSLLTTLQSNLPVGLLFFNQGMYELAKCFAKESGERGEIGHVRNLCSYGYGGECCSYGPENGKDIALQLLIDHDVPSLGHREICLSPDFVKIGVSIASHKTYEHCCVLDFQRNSRENLMKETYEINKNEIVIIPEPYHYEEIANNNDQVIKIKKHKLLSIKIGCSANLLTDDISNFSNSINNQLSYQINSMVGFNLGKHKKNSSFSFFNSYGKYNQKNTTVLNNTLLFSSNNYFEIECGFLIKEFFRLSGGFGYSKTNSITFNSFDYNTITTGFTFGPKWLKFEIENTLMISKSNKKLFMRPSVGLSFCFSFFNKKA